MMSKIVSTRFASVFGRPSNAVRGLHHSRALCMAGGSIPDDEKMRPFYALGVSIARQVGGDLKSIMSKHELAIMIDGFAASMKDEVSNDVGLLQTYGNELNAILKERSGAIVDVEKKQGEGFCIQYLADNPTAVRTSSGLIYHETIPGIGAQPSVTDKVEVHYHGTLMNGQVFDSSVERGETISFPLANVIKGWQEGVAMMKEGGKATLLCPSEIAYGDKGSPPVIPPGATLKFEVELIKVN